ncbi:MAG: alpha/beta hydrolase [Flavobacteriaceae bacterium]|nr:alpha/beta hydrolase [Flavobacteriaceae bacterium]
MGKPKNISKETVIHLYYQQLDALPFSYTMQTIETSFGDTNMLVAGEAKHPALLLLHHQYSCAPIAIKEHQSLLNCFKIYAIDIPGFLNLSSPTAIPTNTNAYGQWLYELGARMQIQQATLVGIGYGAYIACKAMLYHNNRFKRGYLIHPIGLVGGNFWPSLFQLYLPLFLFKRMRCQWALNIYLKAIGMPIYSKLATYTQQAVIHTIKNMSLAVASCSTLQKTNKPLHILLAEQDVYLGKDLIQKHRFSNMAEAVYLSKGKHIADQKALAAINDYIIKTKTL